MTFAAAGMHDFIAVTGVFGVAAIIGLNVFILTLIFSARGRRPR